jgi:carbamoyl-phosphate synthase large subunit
MKEETIKIGITCIGFPMWNLAIEAFKATEGVDVQIVGMDVKNDVPARKYLDSYITIPPGNSEDYTDTLFNICKNENIKVLIAGADEEVIALTEKKDEFISIGVICIVPKKDKVDLFYDKLAMYDFLSENGVTVPSYMGVRTLNDLEHACRKIPLHGGKFIVKLSRSRGGRGIFLVSLSAHETGTFFDRNEMAMISLTDMAEIVESTKDSMFMAMEYLEGDYYDVDVLSDNGVPVYLIQRKRVNPKGIPWQGSEITDNKKMADISANICNLLSLHYLYDFDMFEKDGIVYPLEINPRLSGSTCATFSAGINLYGDLLKMALNLPIERKTIPYGKKIYPRFYIEVQ